MLLDKVTGLFKSCACKSGINIKKTAVFFVAFALAVTIMGGSITAGSKNGAFIAEAQTLNGSANGETEKNDAEQVREMVAAAKLSTMSDEQKQKLELRQQREAEESKAKEAKEAADKAKKELNAEKQSDSNKNGMNGFVYSQNIPLSYQLQEYTYQKCVERGLEYELVLAVMWRESRFNVNAVNVNTNGTRDNGLMQINDCNKKWLYQKYGITNLMDPYQNIDAGTAMLGELTAKYGSHNAMMAYQYGEGGMAHKLRQGKNTSREIESAYRQRDYYRQFV